MIIKSIQQGTSRGGFACGPVPGYPVMEILVDDNGDEVYFSATYGYDELYVYKSDTSLLDDLIEEEDTSNYLISSYSCLSEILEASQFHQLFYYILSGEFDIDDSDELNIDADELIEEAGIFQFPTEKEEIYRLRLSYEAAEEQPCIMTVINGNIMYPEQYDILVDMCEDDYDDWVEEFQQKAFDEVKDEKYLTCTGVFVGIGDFTEVVTEEEYEELEEYIFSCGSAVMSEPREATEDEIKWALSL